MAAVPPLPIRAKPARAHLRACRLLQACVQFVLELWERRLPWLLVAPDISEAFLPVLSSLPGVEGFKQDRWFMASFSSVWFHSSK